MLGILGFVQQLRMEIVRIDGVVEGGFPNTAMVGGRNALLVVEGFDDIPVIILDPDGNSVIPDLRITKSLSILGFIIDQDESGNVNCAPILS